MTDQEKLAKAKAKALSNHFSKAASDYSAEADLHGKAAEAEKTFADHHVEQGKTAETDREKAHHKAAAAFHKSKTTHHEKLSKLHKSTSEHYTAMASANDSDDAEKIYKAFGIEIEEEKPLSTEVTKTITPEVTPTPAKVEAAAPAPTTGENFNDYIQKALDKKLGESVNAAFERVLSSEDFGKRVDQEIAKKLLEKLGSSTMDTPVKTFPVPRPGSENGNGAGEVDPQLLDLVKSME